MKSSLTLVICGLFGLTLVFGCNKAPNSENKSLDITQQKSDEYTQVDNDTLVQLADEIALNTFKAMSSALQQAMREGGVKKAVSFCNVEAQPIADSLSTLYGVKVSRVSDRPRNSANKANDLELGQLAKYEAVLSDQNQPKTVLLTSENAHLIAYKPIQIKALCLNCHGSVGQELSEENDAFIKSLYPNDLATSYKEGDLRGMWKVEFKEGL